MAAGPLPAPVRVTVLARDGTAAGALARSASVRAAISGTAVAFAAERLPAEARAVLARLRPAVLVCLASAQSPYERSQAPSAWTDLVARAGFGVTLALQAGLAARLAGALAEVSPATLLVNGCFPDAVNPLLASLGRPAHCGLGNVATLAACLQSRLGRPDQRGLRMLGHHVHLAPPDGTGEGPQEVRAWCDGRPLAGVTALLAADRALPRIELNAIAGHAGARLVAELATGSADLDTNLPGPLGLPGGYPVRLRGRDITLDLPDGVSRAEAVDWNTAAGRRDGVEVTGGRVGYPERARAALAECRPGLAAGWPATSLAEVFEEFVALRQVLRTVRPAVGRAAG
jgi:hypothetical protein